VRPWVQTLVPPKKPNKQKNQNGKHTVGKYMKATTYNIKTATFTKLQPWEVTGHRHSLELISATCPPLCWRGWVTWGSVELDSWFSAFEELFKRPGAACCKQSDPVIMMCCTFCLELKIPCAPCSTCLWSYTYVCDEVEGYATLDSQVYQQWGSL
jgi:hypothetical protein